MAKSNWQRKIAYFWEYPLSVNVDNFNGWLWLSGDADSLSFNTTEVQRRTWGDRYFRKEHLRVSTSAPSGGLGKLALWHDDSGNTDRINRVLNNHFQNTEEMCPPYPLPCFVAHYPITEVGSTLSGCTILKDIGDGISSANVFESCIASNLQVSWKAGEPVFITPSYRALNGHPRGNVTGAIVSASEGYQDALCKAPEVKCEWNGVKLNVASWKITSTNNVTTKYEHNQVNPSGFVLGNFDAELELQVWQDDDYNSRFVPNNLDGGLVTSTLGEFVVSMKGFSKVSTPAHYYHTITFKGKVISPTASPNSANGLQTIKVKMYKPNDATGYENAGYCIKIDGEYSAWRNF